MKALEFTIHVSGFGSRPRFSSSAFTLAVSQGLTPQKPCSSPLMIRSIEFLFRAHFALTKGIGAAKSYTPLSDLTTAITGEKSP